MVNLRFVETNEMTHRSKVAQQPLQALHYLQSLQAAVGAVQEAAQADDGAEEVLGEAGRLARAWTDGYGCCDESELFQLTGGRLTR